MTTNIAIEVTFTDGGKVHASLVCDGEKIGVNSIAFLGLGLPGSKVKKAVKMFHEQLGSLVMGLCRKHTEAEENKPIIIDPSAN